MQKQFKYDDAYLFDLDVPVRQKPEMKPENFEYDYEVPDDMSTFITFVMERSYHSYVMEEHDEYWHYYTNCEPDAFKLIYERAFMERYYIETGVFCVTRNEELNGLDLLIRDMSGRTAWSIYNPIGEEDEQCGQSTLFANLGGNAIQKQFKHDDPYVFDLDVPVRQEPELKPEDYDYDYEVPTQLFSNLLEVLIRSYHSRIIDIDHKNNIVHIYTNCEPDAFKLVYERAFMEKIYDEIGIYYLTKNENGILSYLIPKAADKNDWRYFDAQKLLQIGKLVASMTKDEQQNLLDFIIAAKDGKKDLEIIDAQKLLPICELIGHGRQ